MIQNKINNFVSMATFLLYNKMLSGSLKSENGSRDEVLRQNRIQAMRLYDAKNESRKKLLL